MMGSGIFRVLSNRSFLFLWLAEVFSQIAFNMVNFILIIIVYELANSSTAVSGLILSFTIPAITFGIIAGVYVDRWDKKKVLFLTNVARTFLLILLAVFHLNLPFVYALSFATAVITQFFIPAETPMIPLLVKKDQLLSANALFGMGIYGSILVAYALSGPFIIFFGNIFSFLIIGVFFLFAAFLIQLIKVPGHKKNKENNKSKNTLINFSPKNFIREEIKQAFALIARTKAVYRSLFLLTLSQTIILILAVIGPGFTKQVLGTSVEQFPLLIVTPAAFGMVIGAIIIGNFFQRISKETMANTGVLLSGIIIFFLPFGSKVASKSLIDSVNSYLPNFLILDIFHIMIFLAFLLGFANALVFVPSNTLLQEKTSDELRGKVYGTLNALSGIFSLFPIIIVGSLSDLFGVGKVLTGIGLLIFGFGALFRFIAK